MKYYGGLGCLLILLTFWNVKYYDFEQYMICVVVLFAVWLIFEQVSELLENQVVWEGEE